MKKEVREGSRSHIEDATPEEEAQANAIRETRLAVEKNIGEAGRILKEAQESLAKLQEACPHNDIQDSPMNGWTNRTCLACGKGLGLI